VVWKAKVGVVVVEQRTRFKEAGIGVAAADADDAPSEDVTGREGSRGLLERRLFEKSVYVSWRPLSRISEARHAA
jgi:hypothetical protein